MKIIAVTRILNESDIVEAFIRHTAHYVDHHVLVDNGSVDGTVNILQELRSEGLPLTLFQGHSRSFVEGKILTFLYNTAVRDLGADWVVFLDTDEFIDDRELAGGLRGRLSEFSARHGSPACVEVPYREYQLTPEDSDDLLVTERMTYRSQTEVNVKVIAPADLERRQAYIEPGSHGIVIDRGRRCPAHREPGLRYAHFPVRSPYQWMSKAIIGWAKVLASGGEVLKAQHAIHYKEPFERLRSNPSQILRDDALLRTLVMPPDLVRDPIIYRGEQLKYSQPTDYPIRSVQVVTQYLHQLATQHGELMDLFRGVLSRIDRSESGVSRIF